MAEPVTDYARKFLVIIDDTPECDRAVTFAAYRVKRTGGTVVMMSVIDTGEFEQYMGVGEVMRAEARDEAERNLDARIARINSIGTIRIETVIREGDGPTEIDTLIREDSGIAILALAAGTGPEGPGSLVTHFATRANTLPVLLTIVPGSMTDEQIIAVC
ncbi:MAG: universal stress protein [Devosia sp.]|nr:universal stress protein [Devosia sp.]